MTYDNIAAIACGVGNKPTVGSASGVGCAPNLVGWLMREVLDARAGNCGATLYWACRRAIVGGASVMADLRPLIEAAHTAGLTDLRAGGMTEAEMTAVSALRRAGVAG